MRLSELMQRLEVLADNAGDKDPIVLLATQPRWPLAHHVSGAELLLGTQDMTGDIQITWKAGDSLLLRECKSEPGKGLNYPAWIVTAEDDGVAGGCDVHDAMVETDDGKQDLMSFYGYSVERNLTTNDEKDDEEPIIWISEGGTFDKSPYAPKEAWGADY